MKIFPHACFLTALLLGQVLFCSVANGQQLPVKFNDVIPPSPNAASLGKFGDVPVGLVTGIPNISVPIYSYKGLANGLSLDVSLGYHAGGLRLADVSSNVGIGWALNAGGMISRTISGKSDEGIGDGAAGFMNTDTLPGGEGPVMRVEGCLRWAQIGVSADPGNGSLPCAGDPSCINWIDFNKIVDIYNGRLDASYDIFNYSFGSYSGKFIIGKDGSILQIPQTNLKITKSPGASLSSFTIVTPEGVRYVFSDKEFTNLESTSNYPGGPSAGAGPVYSPMNTDAGSSIAASSWYLSKIYTPSGSDSISFTYQGAELKYDAYMGETYMLSTGFLYQTYQISTGHYGTSHGVFNEMRILTIQLPDNTSVNFGYDQSTPRIDVGSSVKSGTTTPAYALRKIDVSNNGKLLAEYGLYQSYMTSHGHEPYTAPFSVTDLYNYRLRLDSIAKMNGVLGQPYYSFSYYKGDGSIPGRFSFAQDHWGFYNGANSNRSLITEPTNINADRDAHESIEGPYAALGTLNRITYPTGGSTQFEFENNKVGSMLTGGIRVKKTTDNDGISRANDITTVYTYPGGGNYYIPPVYTYTFFKAIPNSTPQNEPSNAFYNCYSSFSHTTLGEFQGCPTSYGLVIVSKVKDGIGLGRTEHSYVNNGASLYFGADPDYAAGRSTLPFVATPFLDWANGLQSKEEYYDDQNKLLRRVQYDYDITTTKVNNSNFKSLAVGLAAGPPGDGNSDCNAQTTGQERDYTIYNRHVYYPYTGKTTLTATTETDYDKNGNAIVKQTSNVYDLTYQFLTEQTTSSSKDEQLKTTYKYPFNFLSNPIYQGMAAQNIISPVIEQTQLVDNSQTSFIRTNYDKFSVNNIYRPKFVEMQIRNNPMETVSLFNQYDAKGNILERQKPNDVKEVYLWGYRGQYPVAKIMGSDYVTVNSVVTQSQIDNAVGNDQSLRSLLNTLRTDARTKNAFVSSYTYLPGWGTTSETDPSGRTNYYEYDVFGRLQAVRDQDNNIVTRRSYFYNGQTKDFLGRAMYYNVEKSGGFTRNNCSPGGTGWLSVLYTVPPKAYSSVISQADADAKAQNDVNTNGQQYANSNGLCVFSNVSKIGVFTRNNCPAGGSSVTYVVGPGTYTSTISQADADQKAIDDVNLNGQAYANTNGACNLYYNTEQSGFFLRNNCGSGYTGSSVTYTVPANTYSSTTSDADANQKALNDINANGQVYANAHGTCNASCTVTASGSDFRILSSSFSGAGSTITFSVNFSSTITLTAWNSGYLIGVVSNTSCLPTATRKFNVNESSSLGARTWEITLSGSPNAFSVKLLSGTAPASNAAISLRGTYNQ